MIPSSLAIQALIKFNIGVKWITRLNGTCINMTEERLPLLLGNAQITPLPLLHAIWAPFSLLEKYQNQFVQGPPPPHTNLGDSQKKGCFILGSLPWVPCKRNRHNKITFLQGIKLEDKEGAARRERRLQVFFVSLKLSFPPFWKITIDISEKPLVMVDFSTHLERLSTQYGAWFLQPQQWGERHKCRLQAQNSAQVLVINQNGAWHALSVVSNCFYQSSIGSRSWKYSRQRKRPVASWRQNCLVRWVWWQCWPFLRLPFVLILVVLVWVSSMEVWVSCPRENICLTFCHKKSSWKCLFAFPQGGHDGHRAASVPAPLDEGLWAVPGWPTQLQEARLHQAHSPVQR